MMSGSAPHVGLNDPSGVTRAILAGFGDGATNGLLQFGPAGPAFRFPAELENSRSGRPQETT